MSADPSSTTKKHRVIAWKPEETGNDTAGRRRFPRWVIVLAAVGGTLLVVLAARTFIVLQKIEAARHALESGAPLPGANTPINYQEQFVTRSRAEFVRSEAMRDREAVLKAPTDHKGIVQRLMTIDTLLVAADKAFGDQKFGIAIPKYEQLSAEAKSLAQALQDRRKATEALGQFLSDAARIEKHRELAPDTFNAATVAHGSAQILLQEGNFTEARKKAEEALTTLHSIEKSIETELENNLAFGRAALARGDGAAATTAFGRALELDPKNEFALKSIERAKNIEKVFSLIADGDRLEKESKFEEAQTAFENASQLDAQSATAQAGTARMKSAIKQRDFDRAVAYAQQAREQRQWDTVISNFESALKIFPDNDDIQRQLAEARVRQREARIQELLTRAYAAERDYDWDGAKRTYLELLSYEPAQADAEEGLLRTGKVIRALLVFEKKIEEARSHAQHASFQNAIAAFNDAMASKPSYLELSPEQNQLKTMLERQSKPVPVTFISDSRTWVTISNVRILNKFERTTVPILPGNYEVIGRRKGYEDVREVLRIRADDPVPPVTIIANKRM